MAIPTMIKIPNFDNYAMHIEGYVVNLTTKLPLKQRGHKRGQYLFVLSKNKKIYSISTAKLMKMTYFKGYTGYFLHKNGLSSDFSFYNLKKATMSEIQKHHRTTDKQVKVVHIDGDETHFKNIEEAAKYYSIGRTTAWRYLTGRTKSVVGDKWFYHT